jgi:hypothetical protein
LVLLHNMSAHKFYCFETNISMLSNEVWYDKHTFPYRTENVIAQN